MSLHLLPSPAQACEFEHPPPNRLNPVVSKRISLHQSQLLVKVKLIRYQDNAENAFDSSSVYDLDGKKLNANRATAHGTIEEYS